MSKQERAAILQQMYAVRDRFIQEKENSNCDMEKCMLLFRAHCELFEVLMADDESPAFQRLGALLGREIPDCVDRIMAAIA